MSDEITSRLAALVKQGRELCDGLESEDDAWIDDADAALYESWLASVGNLILAIGGVESDHFVTFRRIVTSQLNPAGVKTYVVRQAFDLTLAVFEQWSQGAMRRIEDIISATTYDGFLDHAEQFERKGRNVESGAVAGAVLTNALRRIASRNSINPSGSSMVTLVEELAAVGVFTERQSERAARYARLQDRAIENGWADVDVGDLIEGSRRLIEEFL